MKVLNKIKESLKIELALTEAQAPLRYFASMKQFCIFKIN